MGTPMRLKRCLAILDTDKMAAHGATQNGRLYSSAISSTVDHSNVNLSI